MAAATIIDMEDALIAKIKSAVMVPGAQKVRGVESLPGAWDDEMLSRVLRAVPGIFVSLEFGQRLGSAGALDATIDARWIVYTATGHASGEAARRRGDALQVGAYELVAVLAPLLHGYTIDNAGTLDLLGVENLYTGSIDKKGLAIYALTFSMPLTFDLVVPDSALADFETFDALYDIPTFSAAAYPGWLTGDFTTAKPDAHDTVALPQT